APARQGTGQDRRPEPAPPEPRRRLPGPHRTGRGAERRRGHPGRSTPMTTATVAVPQAPGRAPVSWVLSDAAAMTRRNLLRYLRLPNLLVFSTIQPVMFVLLFAYVFGGAIKG